jgi:hypothetical protein
MEYNLPWDRITLAWTASTVILLVGLGGFLSFRAWRVHQQGHAVGALVVGAAICFLALAPLAGVAPMRIRLLDSRLEVVKLAGVARYDLSKVKSAEIVPYESVFTSGTWRTFGVGGPFGQLGRFSNQQMGAFRAEVTCRSPLVVIRFEEGLPLVISPESPAAVLEHLQRAGRAKVG